MFSVSVMNIRFYLKALIEKMDISFLNVSNIFLLEPVLFQFCWLVSTLLFPGFKDFILVQMHINMWTSF